MDRIPFGIRRLDSIIGGGAPPGSVVLLSGEAGAGSREFIYTSVLMNGLIDADPDLFDLYYGSIDERATPPTDIHYISFTSGERRLRREMSLALADEIVEAGVGNVRFHDLSEEYFRLSPVPREWYTERTANVGDLPSQHDRNTLAEALGVRLSTHARENLVVIDSLTDLLATPGKELEWADIPFLLKGLSKAAAEWEGLILLHVNREALGPNRHGMLVDAADGTMIFEWESGGSARMRTMVVKQFRGVLSRIEAEDIIRFETEIGDAGFDISDVRKIR